VEDASGRRRLDDAADFVRVEVESALRQSDVRVVPVLVQGARMPRAEDLPPSLAELARRNALELSDSRWSHDVGRLISTAERVLGARAGRSGVSERPELPDAPAATPTSTEPVEQRAADPAAADRSHGETRGATSSPRRHLKLGVAAAVIALAVIGGAIIATQGGGGEQGSNRPYQTLLGLLPASIRSTCKYDPKDQWMKDGDATVQARCKNDASYYLSYGLWASPSKAGAWVANARDHGATGCRTGITDAMVSILPAAESQCQDKVRGADKGIAMWWRNDGSRVAAWFACCKDQEASLKQWAKLAKAQ
jgi:hypothetical protein